MTAPTDQTTLRILSYNLQAGARTGRYRDYFTHSWQHVLPHRDKQHRLSAVADTLRQFDVVGLQEADSGSLRSGFIDQTARLASLSDFPYFSHVANRRIGPIASSGNSLLSRLRPASVENFMLPSRVPGRGVLLSRFGDGPNALHVLVAHLSLASSARQQQFKALRRLIADLPHVVLMGDLNCPRQAPELTRFLDETGMIDCNPEQTATFPAWRPRHAIDHVLVSHTMTPGACTVLAQTDSDHLPISVELSLPTAAITG